MKSTSAGIFNCFDHSGSDAKPVKEEVVEVRDGSGRIFDRTPECQRTTERLRESEERLSLALQVSNAGVWDWNMKTGVVWLTPSWFTMLGYLPGEFPERLKTWIRLIHPDDRRDVLAKATEYLKEKKGRGYHLEFRMQSKSGAYVDILSRGEPVEFDEDGVPTRMVGTHIDITDRKKAEKALKNALTDAEEARDKIDAILRSVADGLIVADWSNRVVMMNREAEKLSGVSLNQALSRPIGTLFTKDCLDGRLSAVLVGEEKNISVELEIMDPTTKEPRIIQARTAIVQSREGKKAGTITTLRDVTPEKELDRMKSEFISTAAHELRTPLTSVVGFSEILLNREVYGITDHAAQRDLLTQIHKQGKRLDAIISDLLDLSRIQAGQLISLVKAPLEIGSLINQVVENFRKKFDERRFELFLAKDPICLLADGGKLEQVLENLLNNALKFSPRTSKVRVDGQVIGDRFQVSVEDEGIGMTQEQVGKVFDKFYRADTSNTAVEGLGLGMPIVKNIVEAHGGEIGVTSQKGRGTRVNFTIPLGTADSQHAPKGEVPHSDCSMHLISDD